MGNELLMPAGNINTTQQTIPAYNNIFANSSATSNLFNMGMNSKNYTNDMIMPDCLKTGNITDEQRASIFGPQYVSAQQVQQFQYPQQNNPVFNGNMQTQPQYTEEELKQYYEQLLSQNPNLKITEKGNVYEASNTYKKTGILAGVVTALSNGIIKFCKGTPIKEAFSIKGLALKLPVFVIAGWAVGSLIDSFANRAKSNN